jgi:photosystem II stability/assembly factor-like uncharacterized protein/DNA-binding beta-propeller fold protein YncE
MRLPVLVPSGAARERRPGMRMRRLELFLCFLVAVALTACGEPATPPSPEITEVPTEWATATVEPSPTPAPEAIPGGVKTVALAPEGEFLVTGEVDGVTGMAYFLDSAGWLYVFDGACLEVVAKEEVLPSPKEGYLYEVAVDSEAGRVYVADGAREEILILDSETLSPLGSIDRFGRITVDPVTHLLYVAEVGVYVADGETGEIIDRIEQTIPEEGMELFSGVPRGVDVYVNPDNRHLYVMTDNNTPGSNSRWWLDLYDADDYTLLAEYVPSFNWFSDAPGFDQERGLDYVAGGHPIGGERKLVALDAEGREVDHLWGVRGDVFFSPRQDLIYVAGWDELDVVDPETMNYLETYPMKVTLHDPHNGRFYSMDWSDPTVTVFDEPIVSLAPLEATTEWTRRLPTPGLGDIDSLVLSPTFSDDETLFVAVRESLFTSTDGGDNWMETILPFAHRGTIGGAFSPAYARDRTLLVGFDCTPAGNGILRSTEAGLQWTRANSGLTDLSIQELVFSPDYAHDETIFARGCADGLFKSTDRGVTWRALTADLMPENEAERIDQLVVSPAYTQDRDLWVLTSSHVYRSQDGGEGWERADEGLEGLELQTLVLSPNYEFDKTAFVNVGRGIYLTRDGGEKWGPMELPVSGLWVTDLVLSPDFASDGVLIVVGWDEEYRDHLYRSTDGGETLVEIIGEFSSQSLRTVVFSPHYAADGLLFVATDTGVYRATDRGDTWHSLDIPGAWEPLFVFSPDFARDQTIYAALGQALYRSQDAGIGWTALHESPPTVPTAVPSAVPSDTATPPRPPVESPTPLDCPGLDPTFQDIADWLETLPPNVTDVPNVGCPQNPAYAVPGAWQVFLMWAPGSTIYNVPSYMIWRFDSRTIYVVQTVDRLTGRSEALIYNDTWSEGMPEIPPSCAALTPPTGLEIPIRGFGRAWCDNGLNDRIGFGYGSEQGGGLLIQETERGLYLSLPDGRNFAIDVTDGLALSQ